MLFFHILIPLSLGSINLDNNSIDYNKNLQLSVFSKNDYLSILNEEKQSLGNITIDDIDLSNLEMGFYTYNTTYPLIWEEYESGALTLTQFKMQFLNTSEPAIVDNLNENIEDNNIIKVRLNESLTVELNSPTLGYLIYHTRLFPCTLLRFFVDNGTNIFELEAETDYSVDVNDFIMFNYEDFFKNSPISEFKLYLIWEYDLTIEDWQLTQNRSNNLLIQNQIQNFTVEFHYFFILTGQKYNQSISDSKIFVNNIDIALSVNLPDKNLLNDHILKLNEDFVNINDHLDLNKTIGIFLTDDFSAGQSRFSLNFTADFNLKFVDPVGKTWSIDRLVEGRNIRERIYFPSLTRGPQHIYLKNVSFYEPTIYFEQVIDNSSLFERIVEYFFLNTSITGRLGMKVKIPYLIVGETCPFIFKYISTQTLRIVVTDNIKMPLIGAEVEIYYYDQIFGTYVSKEQIQPISPGRTNENGEIRLDSVPYGNYTVRVYYEGIFLKEAKTTTYNAINYIYTNVPHFPIWIMIFGGINGILLLLGLIFYLKNKKTR